MGLQQQAMSAFCPNFPRCRLATPIIVDGEAIRRCAWDYHRYTTLTGFVAGKNAGPRATRQGHER